MSCPIVPAIIPSTEKELIEVLGKLFFVNEIQIDVVDGLFVPNKSWPYQPLGIPLAVKPYTDKFTLEVDLMTNKPVVAAYEWVKAGADMLVFHIETIEFEVFKKFIENANISIGVSMSGDTKLEEFLPYAELADYVQLMGIASIGSQGQSFNKEVLSQIGFIKQKFPEKMISIDGSVNKETIVQLKKAGACRFVSGSAILGQENMEAAHAELSALVNE